mmetsp:Transcript_29876/g.59998  ORF Transcript_29876/g.59998 Transcript_29876/m.59998 type:complete len:156 (-) Transcript_29876:747-1214(-)
MRAPGPHCLALHGARASSASATTWSSFLPRGRTEGCAVQARLCWVRVGCEESIGKRRKRLIEPTFKEAQADVDVSLLPPVVADRRCQDDGTDGLPIVCQFDIVGMFPLVAQEACAEYFKGANDQPLTTPDPILFYSIPARRAPGCELTARLFQVV